MSAQPSSNRNAGIREYEDIRQWRKSLIGPSRTSVSRVEALEAESDRLISKYNHTVRFHATADKPQLESDVSRTGHSYFSSIWLRKLTLLSLIALFTLAAASLVVVWASNRAQNGFRLVLSSNHYAWTYGPTAVLVVVLSLWRQVDYHCKLMQPWQAMSKRSVPAANSVLLDYISPINITSLARAMRNRHYPVVASIVGFAVLKLIILFSTGLFVLSPTLGVSEFPIILEKTFDGSDFWTTVGRDSDQHPYSNVSTAPIYSYLRLLDENSSLVFDNQAFQHFHVISAEAVTNASTTVDAFSPSITCEIANATLWYPALNWMQLETDTCSVQTNWPRVTDGINCTSGSECAPPDIRDYVGRVNCSSPVSETFSNELPAKDTDDMRYVMVVSNMSYHEATSGNDTMTIGFPRDTVAVLCRIDYSIDKARATLDIDDDSFHLDRLDNEGRHLENLTGLELGELLYTAILSVSYVDAIDGPQADVVGYLAGPDGEILDVRYPAAAFGEMTRRTLGDGQALDQLLSAKLLQETAEEVWSGLTTQFMQRSFLKPVPLEAVGEGVYTEDRLQVSEVALWLMFGGFILLIICTVVIMVTQSHSIVPQRPGLLSTAASILASSPDPDKLLQNAGQWRLSRLRNELRGFTFHTVRDTHFEVKATYAGALTPFDDRPKAKKATWIPTAARYDMVSMTLIAPIAGIIVLEVLFQQSRNRDGLMDVSGSEDMAAYLSRGISALLCLLVATNFNSLDFTISSMAPFSLLRQGNMPANRSMQFELLGKVPPLAFINSMRKRHFSSALSNLAGMLGSVLTVIASGLWIVDRVPVREAPVSASLTSGWDINWLDSTQEDGGAAVRLNEVQHGSTEMPNNIWYNALNGVYEAVLPSVSEFSPSESVLGSPANYTFDIPSLRPELSCEVISEEHIELKFEFQVGGTRGGSDGMHISISAPLPDGCQKGGENGTNKVVTFNMTENINLRSEPDPPGPDPVTWMAAFYNLHLGPWDAPDDEFPRPGDYDESKVSLEHQPDNPAGCPSIGIIFAGVRNNDTLKSDVTALLCSQRIQQVDLRVAYERSANGQVNRHPITEPFALERTARYLSNGTEGIDSFPYRVQQHLNDYLLPFNQNEDQQRIDPFFNNLVYGPDGIEFLGLMGVSNHDWLISTVQKLYSKYMTLVIDMHFRRSLSEMTSTSSAQAQRLEGTETTMTSRLKMSYASKLVLQIILAIMTALGALAFGLTDLRGTLPRNPCSIASTMGFLAGSELCDRSKPEPLLPKGAEWLSKKDLDKVFEGWLFSLGWWHRSDETVNEVTQKGRATTLKSANVTSMEMKGKRFGIDVGRPQELGLREKTWWNLRRRLGSGRNTGRSSQRSM